MRGVGVGKNRGGGLGVRGEIRVVEKVRVNFGGVEEVKRRESRTARSWGREGKRKTAKINFFRATLGIQ